MCLLLLNESGQIKVNKKPESYQSCIKKVVSLPLVVSEERKH